MAPHTDSHQASFIASDTEDDPDFIMSDASDASDASTTNARRTPTRPLDSPTPDTAKRLTTKRKIESKVGPKPRLRLNMSRTQPYRTAKKPTEGLATNITSRSAPEALEAPCTPTSSSQNLQKGPSEQAASLDTEAFHTPPLHKQNSQKGPSGQPAATGKVQKELEEIIQKENQQLKEKQDIILQIAGAIDETLGPVQQKPHLANFANKAKEAVLDALHRQLQPKKSTVPKTTSPQEAKPQTYAEIAARPPGPKAAQKQIPSQQDTRIFIRLPENSPLKTSHPFNVLKRVRDSLGDKADLVKIVQRTRTGFAIVPTSLSNKTLLLQQAEKLREDLKADKVEENSTWSYVLLPSVPKILTDAEGPTAVDLEMVKTEIRIVTGEAPLSVRWTKATEHSEKEGAIVAAFPKNPPTPFRIFCDGPYSRRLHPNKNTELLQCTNCLKWHRSPTHTPQRCWSESRCVRCGEKTRLHSSTPCQKDPRCANCTGAHCANDTSCPAKPNVQEGRLLKPTKKQLHAIRRTAGMEGIETAGALNQGQDTAVTATGISTGNGTTAGSTDSTGTQDWDGLWNNEWKSNTPRSPTHTC